jgi:3-dehydroquinate dehydratase/shikimate dehydrogenase
MAGQKASPLIEAKDLNAKLIFDLVYNPLETPLIRLARQQGIPFITGVEMFVQQGARQFEIWTGKPAPEEEMLRVVIHALRQQAEAAATETVVEPKATTAKRKKAS